MNNIVDKIIFNVQHTKVYYTYAYENKCNNFYGIIYCMIKELRIKRKFNIFVN